jgi:3-dehydroquinate synthase class II
VETKVAPQLAGMENTNTLPIAAVRIIDNALNELETLRSDLYQTMWNSEDTAEAKKAMHLKNALERSELLDEMHALVQKLEKYGK